MIDRIIHVSSHSILVVLLVYSWIVTIGIRAAVATGAWVKSKHDMHLIRGSVGA